MDLFFNFATASAQGQSRNATIYPLRRKLHGRHVIFAVQFLIHGYYWVVKIIRHCFFFTDDKLILLDPHCSQDCVNVLKDDFPVEVGSYKHAYVGDKPNKTTILQLLYIYH